MNVTLWHANLEKNARHGTNTQHQEQPRQPQPKPPQKQRFGTGTQLRGCVTSSSASLQRRNNGHSTQQDMQNATEIRAQTMAL